MATTIPGGVGYTPVKEFFRDRSIFITGGTGFMGKVLVEKLLRSCPGIKNIYLLMRPKRGQGVQQRLQELLNSPVSSISPCLPINLLYTKITEEFCFKVFLYFSNVYHFSLGISYKQFFLSEPI